MDIRGDEWVKKRNKDGSAEEFFWYNAASWETRNDRPPTVGDGSAIISQRPPGVAKPQYATDWYDSRYPEWVEYIEFTSKRKYYFNSATKEVSWAHPESGTRDADAIFRAEIEAQTKSLTRVPADARPAPLWKRVAAASVDFSACFAGGCFFGALMYVDLEDIPSAQLGIALSTWGAFIGRDMVFERGTRSLGKRLLKLEVVRLDGQLPTRWHTAARNFYAPLYTAVAVMPPAVFALSAVELGLLLFTPQATRIGDLLGRTRVIDERADRKERLAEKISRDDADDAKD